MMINKYPKKRFWLILIIIFLLVLIIGCTQFNHNEKLKESINNIENDDVNTLATSPANLTSNTTPPTEKKSEIIGPPAENTSVTGKGWIKAIARTHVCKEPCPGEFSSSLSLSAQQTSDGGYVTAGAKGSPLTHTPDGFINDPTSYHVYLFKIDAEGNFWNKTYGLGYGRAVQQTSDGGYIIAVHRPKNEIYGREGSYLLKVDASGDTQWTKTFEVCPGNDAEIPTSILQAADGGYMIIGQSFNCGSLSKPKTEVPNAGSWPNINMFWLKTDAEGNKIWNKTMTVTAMDDINSVFRTSDGGYMTVIYTSLFGVKQEPWLIKVDANLNTQWNKTFGEYTYDVGSSVRQTPDGGFMLIQRKNFPFTQRSEYELYTFKLGADGSKLWEKRLALSRFPELLEDDWVWSAAQASDGGYIAVARRAMNMGGGINGFYLVKFDANGNDTWYKRIDINTWGQDVFSFTFIFQPTSDGGYMINGVTGRAFYYEDIRNTHPSYPADIYYFIKTDANGNI